MRWLALFATAADLIGQAPDPLQKVYASAVAEYNAGRIAQARTQLENCSTNIRITSADTACIGMPSDALRTVRQEGALLNEISNCSKPLQSESVRKAFTAI